ncbi:polypeptide N-acetylgalactosaminyltransferase 5 [Aplysia californica]|uniref:Polypeptide N-acetylgalactosaminyltransferase n=1 Tax=Aplysia californica TaxID=6500 RepID=A0ABM1A5I4_APLCA|nr:polypeptide N-acetylgalactosaminyltransferase 5 [Aplysia californica]
MREGWKAHNFNEFVNRKISVRRSLPECSNSACRGLINGTKTTQQISVVLIFHNEAWCTLLRSVHSILDRTPEHILEEVVLVDDMSSLDSNKAPLDKYFQDYPQVKIVRSPVRGGLTKARLLGFESSIAPIVVFLDSHIECMPGWAEPLVIRIEEDPTAVVYPLIETISDKTFAVTCTPQPTNIGRLNIMNLLFQWMPIPQREKDRRKSDADPVRSPTMPGGLFAISRDYFNKLGTYDPDLTYWGGENMELSFKVWQCGGSVELVPCSHIAHVFRHHITARWNSTRDEVKVNNMRVAEVWMDDYKNYYYEAINYVQVPFGDISARKKLREDLSCKSFGWFIKNFYPEFALPLDVVSGGHITSEFFPTPMCVDSKGGTVKPELYQCHPQSGNQIWFLNKAGVLSFDKLFVCGKEDGTVSLSKPNPCPGEGPQWEFTDDNSLLHLPTDLCLTVTQGSNEITLESCEDETNQHWIFPLRRTDIVFPVPDVSDV